MDLQTLEMGNILLAKYRLCENMLEYMSDPDAVTGQKYKEKCGEFFKVFHDEMLVFTHELMTKCGEEFNNLHCECHTESEKPSQPEYGTTPPVDAKYQIGDRVEIIGGDISVLIGRIGTIVGYDDAETKYLVRLGGFSEGALPLMYAEGELVPYVEESEDSKGFVIGDRVKVVLSTDENYERIGTVEDVEQEFIVVVLDGEEYADRLWFYPEDLELYTDPENPEENGAGDTDPTEGE